MQAAGVGQGPGQGVVDRAFDGLRAAHQVNVKAEPPQGQVGGVGGGHQFVDNQNAVAGSAIDGIAVDAPVVLIIGDIEQPAAAALPVFGGLGVALPVVHGPLENGGPAFGAAPENLRQFGDNIGGVDEGDAAGAVVGPGIGVVLAFNAPLFVQGGDAVAEASVDEAFGGEQGRQGFAAPVNVVDLMAHHAGEDALAGVGGLHGYVGHAGDHGGGPRNGHFQAVGMGAADDVVALKDGDGAGQVEVGPQRFRVVGQTVAVRPGFRPQPRLEFLGRDRP